jgi:hypothetical protein
MRVCDQCKNFEAKTLRVAGHLVSTPSVTGLTNFKFELDLCRPCLEELCGKLKSQDTEPYLPPREPDRNNDEQAEHSTTTDALYWHREGRGCNKPDEELRQLLCDVAQLLDGWHNDGTAWSEWDESVRKRVLEMQLKLEPPTRGAP